MRWVHAGDLFACPFRQRSGRCASREPRLTQAVMRSAVGRRALVHQPLSFQARNELTLTFLVNGQEEFGVHVTPAAYVP